MKSILFDSRLWESYLEEVFGEEPNKPNEVVFLMLKFKEKKNKFKKSNMRGMANHSCCLIIKPMTKNKTPIRAGIDRVRMSMPSHAK